MIVTAITQQVKDKNRYSIFIDGEYAFSLGAVDVAYFHLKEGKEIPANTYDFIKDFLLYTKAQNTALTFLSYKMRTKQEVIEKLREKEYAPEVIDRVILFLENYHYIQDKQYAISFLKEKGRLRPMGVRALTWELREKGVAREVIEEVLLEEPVDEFSAAFALLQKKFRGQDITDRKVKQRLMGYLQRRGFSYETISAVLKEAQTQGDRISF